MKALIILTALALTACGTEEKKDETTVSESGHVLDVKPADKAQCQEESRADEELEGYLRLFIDKYDELGKRDLPIGILDRLTVLRRENYENMSDEDGSRNGYMKRVACGDGLLRFHIVVADPDTVPDGSSLKNPLLFAETVFHEIAHVFYGHYDDDESTVTTKAGLMAAQKNIRTTTEEDHGKRIEDLFGNENYKAHLPKRFHVNQNADDNNG